MVCLWCYDGDSLLVWCDTRGDLVLWWRRVSGVVMVFGCCCFYFINIFVCHFYGLCRYGNGYNDY